MAGTPKSRASDFTGRQKEAAAKKNAEEQAKRAEEMSMATQAAQESMENEVIDLSNGGAVLSHEEADELVEQEVELSEKVVKVRVNEDLDMTYGDASYKMSVGPWYTIPAHVADWLEERGVIWH